MLTYAFILTLYFATMGGGGITQIIVQATSEPLCKSLRRAVMTQFPDANGHAGPCYPLLPPNAIVPEKD